MLFAPLNHPLNWYRYDVKGSLELLDSYVSDIESQVAKGIANFEANAETIVVEGKNPEEPPRFIQIHQSLDDQAWDLGVIFCEYFPNLQRRSALITLFSFFEYELNKACNLFQEFEKYQVSLGDISGVGIERAKTYLRKVASLDLNPATPEWTEVKNIQALRNLIVHADGRILDGDGKKRSGVARYVKESPHLVCETEVFIRAGYLKHVLNSFNAYFEQINNAIKRRYET
jgi:hypothetical protein